MTKIAVLASHNGSGFDALYNASISKELDIEIVLVISNNTNALVLQKASSLHIKNFLINNKTHEDPNSVIESLLKEHSIEYVYLSGYMKKISEQTTREFKIINSHPALLPSYGGNGMYGRHVHEAVIKNNEEYSGVTIHHVNEEFDKGEIILQKKLKLDFDESVDSLEMRIKELEKTAIVEGFAQCLK